MTDLGPPKYYYYERAGNQARATTFVQTSPNEMDGQGKGLHGRSPRRIAVTYNKKAGEVLKVHYIVELEPQLPR